MDVENLAVNAVVSRLSVCSRLRSFISTNDKTPFTDGHIDLHSDVNPQKSNWLGRVPVQVKGRKRTSATSATLSFAIDQTELRAFQRDSGVLYFYVAVNSKGHCAPFYALLSPSAIESFLINVPPTQKRVSIPFKALPDDPARLEAIVELALKTRDQNIALGFDPALFEHVQSLTVHTAQQLDFSSPIVLSPGETDFALVLETETGMSIPLMGEIRIIPGEYIEHPIEVSIAAGGIEYDKALVRRTSEDTVALKFSDGLSMALIQAEGRAGATVNLTLSGGLPERLKDVQFYLALAESRMITVNGVDSPFEITGVDPAGDLLSYRGALLELSELFAVLGVDPTLIDLKDIDDEQMRSLRVLYRAFVQLEEISDRSVKVSRAFQRIGSWNVMFLVLPGSSEGLWRLVDPFAPATRQQFRWQSLDGDEGDVDGNTVLITAYNAVERGELSTVVNLRLEAIVDAFENIRDQAKTSTIANQQVLDLISAADVCPLRKVEFLTAAERLADWVIDRGGETAVHLINRWQTLARLGKLGQRDRVDIRQLRREAILGQVDDPVLVEVACALLLGEHDEAEERFAQWPGRASAHVRQWPIWKLSRSALFPASG